MRACWFVVRERREKNDIRSSASNEPSSRRRAANTKFRLGLCLSYRFRLLQAEFQQRFARHFHLLAFGQHLHASTCGPSGRRANRCALSATSDCADNGASSSEAANFLRRVGATPLALQRVVSANYRIFLPINNDGGH